MLVVLAVSESIQILLLLDVLEEMNLSLIYFIEKYYLKHMVIIVQELSIEDKEHLLLREMH